MAKFVLDLRWLSLLKDMQISVSYLRGLKFKKSLVAIFSHKVVLLYFIVRNLTKQNESLPVCKEPAENAE